MRLVNTDYTSVPKGNEERTLSSTYSKLIQYAGNCQAYNSDILIDIESIKGIVKKYNNNPVEACYIGIRKLGTDFSMFPELRETEYIYRLAICFKRIDDDLEISIYEY